MFRLKVAAVLTIATFFVGAMVAAQNDGPTAGRLMADAGLPGIDTGVRNTGSPRALRPDASDRIRRSSALPYLRGSIVVKFKAGTAATAQRAMLTRVGASTMTADPYSDFSIVPISDAMDPEAAASALASQPDVEYAQARYRVHPMFVPNDPLYSLQWNFPAIDMERAWDVNPGANSSIIVAVLDSGVAFKNVTIRYNIPAWRFEGTLLPALG